MRERIKEKPEAGRKDCGPFVDPATGRFTAQATAQSKEEGRRLEVTYQMWRKLHHFPLLLHGMVFSFRHAFAYSRQYSSRASKRETRCLTRLSFAIAGRAVRLRTGCCAGQWTSLCRVSPHNLAPKRARVTLLILGGYGAAVIAPSLNPLNGSGVMHNRRLLLSAGGLACLIVLGQVHMTDRQRSGLACFNSMNHVCRGRRLGRDRKPPASNTLFQILIGTRLQC